MAQNSSAGPSGRKQHLFARRQVYLRAGQDSQYVELSPLLQIGVAAGFGVLALWLIGASYGAVTGYGNKDQEVALQDQLNLARQALGDAEQERDAALINAAKVPDLEAELTSIQAAMAARAPEASMEGSDETLALTAELEQTKLQLEDLHLRLSEEKADKAALQARFEAEVSATTDASEKTAEEAQSLHAQLEEAFGEVEGLKEERDALTAKLAALNEENDAKSEATERNTALLKAATAEIERLQDAIALAEADAENVDKEHAATITKLDLQLGDLVGVRDALEEEVVELRAELSATKATTSNFEALTSADDTDVDAKLEAQSIALDLAALKETDLLATIDDLRAELAADIDDSAGATETFEGDEAFTALKERVALAESEIERLILSGLTSADEPDPAASPAPDQSADDRDEAERLRAELLAARADNIKLNADVKAAKQRLAERAESENGQASRPDNSAKLEQQLASTRSRVQQLNKALADAKLREVAIDLALISVIPSPSPPAPR